MKNIFNKIYASFFGKKKRAEDIREINMSVWALKRELSEQEKIVYAEKVFSKIEELSVFQKADTVLVYWSSKLELPTHKFVRKWVGKKQILIPLVKNNKLSLKKIISCENEDKKLMTKPYNGNFDLAIIPGIAFDNNKYRMGNGKGLYNRFFAKQKNHFVSIGVGFDFQLVESVPNYWEDLQMNIVITPSTIIN